MERQVLRADAVFAALAGIFLVLASRWVGAQVALPKDAVALVGFALVGYAVVVTAIAAQVARPRPYLLAAFTADVTWIVATFTLLAARGDRMTLAGFLVVLTLAILSAAFGGMKWVAAQRRVPILHR